MSYECFAGQTLVKFGRTHCKIAALQEDYATALQDTYHKSLEMEIGAMKEYHALRKKLDSRRFVQRVAILALSHVRLGLHSMPQ